MKLQNWIVYRRYDKDHKEDIGNVLTSCGSVNEVALAKAYHKYVGKPYICLGYSLHVRKSDIREGREQ